MYKTTLDQWLVFTTVIAEGGFNAAAQKLHRSQSSVSYGISKLQEQLGLKLFTQDGRKMELTKEGERLREEIAPVLRDFQRIETIAQMMATGVESRIRLLVDSIFPRHLLFRAIHQFNQIYPETRVELYDVIRLNPAQHTQFDLAICTTVDGTITGDKLLDVALYPVAHPNHPLGLKRAVTQNDLCNYVSVRFQNSHQPYGGEPPRKGEYWLVNTLEGAASAVRNQIAYGWLPMSAIEEDVREGTMQILTLQDRMITVVPLYINDNDKGINGPATLSLKKMLFEVVAASETIDGQ